MAGWQHFILMEGPLWLGRCRRHVVICSRPSRPTRPKSKNSGIQSKMRRLVLFAVYNELDEREREGDVCHVLSSPSRPHHPIQSDPVQSCNCSLGAIQRPPQPLQSTTSGQTDGRRAPRPNEQGARSSSASEALRDAVKAEFDEALAIQAGPQAATAPTATK